jgi:GNAT superfamily N-acetyltransferase
MYLVADDNLARIDREWLWRMLSTEVYWHRWRTREQIDAQLDGAWRVVGVYDERSGAQVGFARAVSDGVNDAYLADVIVDPAARGQGAGKLLVKTMVEDGPGAEFRWTLFTGDAHGLYAQYGFAAPDPSAMVRPGGKAARFASTAPSFMAGSGVGSDSNPDMGSATSI